MSLFKAVIKDLKVCLNVYHKKKLMLDINHPVITENLPTISYCKNPKRLDDVSKYIEFFYYLIENKNYTCLLSDGSIIQAFYKFSKDQQQLEEGNLVYYPNPGLTVAPEYRLKRKIDFREYEYLSEYTAKYLRIDFDSKAGAYKEITHPCCHIHFSCESDNRIALDKFPFFSEFIKFILFLNSKEEWLATIPTKSKSKLSSIDIDSENYIKHRVKMHKDRFIPAKMSNSEKKHYHVVM